LPYELALEYDRSYDRGEDMGRKTPERGRGDDDDDAKPAEELDRASAETQPVNVRKDDLPEIDPPAPKGEPWPDATPNPALARARTAIVAVQSNVDVGRPPDMPTSSAPPPLVLGAVEDPTHMPGPRDVPSGDPDDAAPPPGRVPPGDSRSLRRANEFALIYRVGTCVITRTGRIGTRGQWRVVEYPTSATASSSYAKECSRFVSDGFSDYRDQ
jgi:predicted DNA-binding WGR domain protein